MRGLETFSTFFFIFIFLDVSTAKRIERNIAESRLYNDVIYIRAAARLYPVKPINEEREKKPP